MNETVFGFLQDYTARGIYPFHMPGHKRNPLFLPPALMGMDITEIPGADNLNQPEGMLLQLQARLARLFGAEETLLTVNGSTAGNLAVITQLCGEGRPILMARNAHRSAFGALALAGPRPVYVMPAVTEYGFCGGVSAADVAARLEENPDVCAVFVTSPTYEGVVSDIAAIAAAAHARGIPLVVDEAHGAHMRFSDMFPRTALECGADIVIQSLHKTMPFLTQTSVIHMQGDLIDRARLKKMLTILQTSSPSYVFMAQVDYVASMLEHEGAAMFRAYADRLSAFLASAKGLRHIRLLGLENEIAGAHDVFALDVNKLVFLLPNADTAGAMTGRDFELTLRDRFRVQLEMSGLAHGIALTSPADTDEGFARLLAGVTALDAEMAAGGTPAYTCPVHLMPAPEIMLSPRAAVHRAAELVCLSEAEGRVAAEFLIPYPPGIPLAAPGERLTNAVLDGAALCLARGIPVVGLTQSAEGAYYVSVVEKDECE